MRNTIKSIAALSLSCFLVGVKSLACTAVFYKNESQNFTARNMDWTNNNFFVVLNPRGQERDQSNDTQKFKNKTLKWQSKYGSISFDLAEDNKVPNLVASLGGMNEKGLTASALWLSDSQYSTNPNKPVLMDSVWTQYMLDNAKNVPEAIALAKKVVVEPVVFGNKKVKLHLVVTDKSGARAIMSYQRGKLVIYQNKDIKYPVVSNNVYSTSLRYIKSYVTFGGKKAIPGSNSSAARFVRAAYTMSGINKIQSTSPFDATSLGFYVLGSVVQPLDASHNTVFSVVYDKTLGMLFYRTKSDARVKQINLRSINFDSDQPVRFININNHVYGYLLNNSMIPLDSKGSLHLYFRGHDLYKKYDLAMSRHGNHINNKG